MLLKSKRTQPSSIFWFFSSRPECFHLLFPDQPAWFGSRILNRWHMKYRNDMICTLNSIRIIPSLIFFLAVSPKLQSSHICLCGAAVLGGKSWRCWFFFFPPFHCEGGRRMKRNEGKQFSHSKILRFSTRELYIVDAFLQRDGSTEDRVSHKRDRYFETH